MLGDGDIVAGGVFDHVHHLVGLTNDFVCALGVFRIGCYAHTGATGQVQALLIEELGVPHHVSQAAGYYERRFLSRLGKQHDKLVAAISECVVDESQVRLDHESDLVQQFASDEMSVGIVDRLEVVEVDEDDAEFVVETMRAIDLGFERLIQMASVVQAGAIVGDRELLDFLNSSGILDSDRGIVAQRVEEEHLVIGKALHGAVDELDHA